MSLQEITNMTQEEADENGVGEYRRIYFEEKKKKEEDDRKELWYAIEGYVRENGFTEHGKINFSKLKRWCETNSIQVPRVLLEYYKQN